MAIEQNGRCPQGVENKANVAAVTERVDRMEAILEKVRQRPPVWASLLIAGLFGLACTLMTLLVQGGPTAIAGQ